MKVLLVIVLFAGSISGLEIVPGCLDRAKNVLCTKFFEIEEREACSREIQPFYKWTTLDLCVSSHTHEHRCTGLNKVCPEYIYVALYQPSWSREEEYEFSCSYVILQFGLPLLFINLLVLMASCLFLYLCRKKREDETPIFRRRIFYETLNDNVEEGIEEAAEAERIPMEGLQNDQAES